MNRLSNDKYIVNYDELTKLLDKGYCPVGDLRNVLEYYPDLLINRKEINIYLNNHSKYIDILSYLIVRQFPLPGKVYLSKVPYDPICVKEIESGELFYWKYQ